MDAMKVNVLHLLTMLKMFSGKAKSFVKVVITHAILARALEKINAKLAAKMESVARLRIESHLWVNVFAH
jgi:hypothetical protein